MMQHVKFNHSRVSCELAAQEISKDGSFISEDNGVVYDKNTCLEWYAGPDENTTWDEAESRVENSNAAGGGWSCQ